MTSTGKFLLALLLVAAAVPLLAWGADRVPFGAIAALAGGDEAAATPTPTPTATPLPARELAAGDDVPLPSDLALFLVPAEGGRIERVYRHGDDVRTDAVLTLPDGARLDGFATAGGAFVALLEGGGPKAMRSTDWGATWSAAGSAATLGADAVTVPGHGAARWQDVALLGPSGAPLLTLDALGGAVEPKAALADDEGSRIAVVAREAGAPEARVTVFVRAAGATPPYRPAASFALAGGTATPAAWLDSTRLVLDAGGPAVLDVRSGTLHRLAGLEAGSRLLAAVHGPFARVEAGAGDCLNVRAEPGLAATIVDCVAHGALLRLAGPAEGGWARIDGPVDGWASTDYLEPAGGPDEVRQAP